jgi:hypothetical protein
MYVERLHCSAETLCSSPSKYLSLSGESVLQSANSLDEKRQQSFSDPRNKGTTEKKFLFGETLLCKSRHQVQLQLTLSEH